MGLIEGKRHSLNEIINIINISKGILSDIKKRGIDLSKHRSGRSKTLTSRDKCRIERFIRINKSTRRITLSRLKSILRLRVYKNIIHKALIELGYNRRIIHHCPFLNKYDKKRRLQFAKNHMIWNKK